MLFYLTLYVYKMSEGVRGRALIINIEKRRAGSKVDNSNLNRLFHEMGFIIAKSQQELTNLSTQVLFIYYTSCVSHYINV